MRHSTQPPIDYTTEYIIPIVKITHYWKSFIDTTQ